MSIDLLPNDKVYIVWHGEYEDREIDRIFASKQLAEEYIMYCKCKYTPDNMPYIDNSEFEYEVKGDLGVDTSKSVVGYITYFTAKYVVSHDHKVSFKIIYDKDKAQQKGLFSSHTSIIDACNIDASGGNIGHITGRIINKNKISEEALAEQMGKVAREAFREKVIEMLNNEY